MGRLKRSTGVVWEARRGLGCERPVAWGEGGGGVVGQEVWEGGQARRMKHGGFTEAYQHSMKGS